MRKTIKIFLLSVFSICALLIQSCKKGSEEVSKKTLQVTNNQSRQLYSAPVGAIIPGKQWFDTNGHEIKCQGGEIYQESGTYYWVGGNYNGSDWHFAGINLYSSTDLVHWTFRNTILSVAAVNGATQWAGRPVLPKKPNGQYIIFVGCDRTGNGNLGYATCSTIDGNYSWNGISKLLGKYEFNDHDIFKDTDGKVYLICSTAEDLTTSTWYDAVIAQCDPTTLIPTTEICKFGTGAVEGVSLFKKGSNYYFFASQKNGWNGTSTKWYTATTLTGLSGGTWNNYNNLAYAPASTTGWDAQNDFTLQVNGNYYWCADRWSNFTGRGNGRYIWEPLNFSGTTPSVNWYDWWTFNTSNGSWSSTLQPQMAGGFETNDNGNWTLTTGATIAQDSANSYTATHCAEMIGYGTVKSNIAVTPNSTYKLQVMGKTNSCTGKIYISYTGFYQEAYTTSTSYAATSLTFTTPSNISTVEIGIFNASNNGTFYADDFELIKQ